MWEERRRSYICPQNNEQQDELRTMLESAYEGGIELYLDGAIASPEEIVNKHCLNEDDVYMADYILNEAGELLQLRYDKVNCT